MKIHVLEDEQVLPVPLEEAWEFFSDVRNLDEITPKEMGFRTEYASGDGGKVFAGQIIVHRVKALPGIWMRWVTEIKLVEEGRCFVDEQRSGPYKFWHHRHGFEEVDGGTRVRDTVHYAMPFGFIGEIAHSLFLRRKSEWLFGKRRELLEERFGK